MRGVRFEMGPAAIVWLLVGMTSLGCDDEPGGVAPDAIAPLDAAVDMAVDTPADMAVDMAAAADMAQPLAPPPDWPRWTADSANSRARLDDRTLHAQRVQGLAPVWSIDGPGATSTPIVLDGWVYTGLWDGRVVALQATTGAVRWSAALGDAHAVNASITVHEDSVYAATGGGDLVALGRDTGDSRWRIAVHDHAATSLFGTPTIFEGAERALVVIGVSGVELAQVQDDYTFRGSVVAYDAATGEEVWRFWTTADDETSGAGVSVWSSAVIDTQTGIGYIGTGNSYEEPASPYSDALLALDMTTGELVWHRQFTEGDVYVVFRPPPQGPDADVGATPNLFEIDGRPVVGVGDKAGVYSVLDRATGETVWARALPEGSPLGGIMVSAAVADGRVFVTSNQWADALNFNSDANTAVAFALDTATGDTVWQTPLPAPSFGAVSVTGDLVWLTTVRGMVHALDRADGSIVWQATLGESAAAGVTATGEWLFAGHGFSMFKAPRAVVGGFTAWRAP